ncbi:hypothetical protein, partial [Novosphingobium capsulatum]|uniref:hypothetical protein n=1 Tax=Novosphingobium capsulatum TaxID=13688 RepID=UPI001C3FDDA5
FLPFPRTVPNGCSRQNLPLGRLGCCAAKFAIEAHARCSKTGVQPRAFDTSEVAKNRALSCRVKTDRL